ncbi:MAG: isoprenyl transferase [Candidatus Alcyoniella australis]|nr:isoprenyl transferase [Candidatus Alcyoniella australis]
MRIRRPLPGGRRGDTFPGMSVQLDKSRLPQHIAVIMDGNGRWAAKRRLGRLRGHRQGIQAVKALVRSCRELKIPYLTIFAFSTENWGRPEDEIDGLMGLMRQYIRSELREIRDNGVRLKIAGDLSRMPADVLEQIDYALEQTAHNTDLLLTICLSYSGRQEILRAARQIAQQAKDGELDPEQIDEQLFASLLYTHPAPDPDLLIRTSGEMRISNFLLWQLAYTEIYVTDTLWPDFDKDELQRAISVYQERERRMGLTGEQLARAAQSTAGESPEGHEDGTPGASGEPGPVGS